MSGLQRHYQSLYSLARTIRHRLHADQFNAKVVVGFTRFGAYLLARNTRQDYLVVPDFSAERTSALRTPIELLPMPPDTSILLKNLCITTVSDFLRLPQDELLQRFGNELALLHSNLHDDLCLPIQNNTKEDQFPNHIQLPYAEINSERLSQYAEMMLVALLDRLRTEDRSVKQLSLKLSLEDGSHRQEILQPATATNDQKRLLNLLSLRLRSIDLGSGVEGLDLDAEHVPTHTPQESLFRSRKQRDIAAGSEALSHIRAKFGNQAVAHAVVLKEHLPEDQFLWKTVNDPLTPQAKSLRKSDTPPPIKCLVRRVLKEPIAIPPPREARNGPFLISSEWWHSRGANLSEGTDRAYYFIESRKGAIEWVYHDRITSRWYLQGWIE